MFHYLKIPFIEHFCLPISFDMESSIVIIKINYKLYSWDIKAPLITAFNYCFFCNKKSFEQWKRNWQNNRSSAKNCSALSSLFTPTLQNQSTGIVCRSELLMRSDWGFYRSRRNDWSWKNLKITDTKNWYRSNNMISIKTHIRFILLMHYCKFHNAFNNIQKFFL